jgi:hypothetical protein
MLRSEITAWIKVHHHYYEIFIYRKSTIKRYDFGDVFKKCLFFRC